MSQRPRRRAPHAASLAERLAFHSVAAPSGCRIWTGAVARSGGAYYGRVMAGGRCQIVHRVSYELFVGPIPDGLQIDHLCRRTMCIKPEHLQAVTASVNVRRGTSPGARALRRESCIRGHRYAEHGAIVSGRRVCRLCRKNYNAAYKARLAVA